MKQNAINTSLGEYTIESTSIEFEPIKGAQIYYVLHQCFKLSKRYGKTVNLNYNGTPITIPYTPTPYYEQDVLNTINEYQKAIQIRYNQNKNKAIGR